MNDLLKSLNNIRTLRSLSKNYPNEILKDILSKLQTIVSERQQDRKNNLLQEIQRNQRLEKYRDLLLADGINIEELLDKKKQSKHHYVEEIHIIKPAKYHFINRKGQFQTWTGQGRMPIALKLALEKEGKRLDDFLI